MFQDLQRKNMQDGQWLQLSARKLSVVWNAVLTFCSGCTIFMISSIGASCSTRREFRQGAYPMRPRGGADRSNKWLYQDYLVELHSLSPGQFVAIPSAILARSLFLLRGPPLTTPAIKGSGHQRAGRQGA